MEHYNLLPIEGMVGDQYWWDCEDCKNACGSLYPIITTEKNAIKYAKSVKKRFPKVSFTLTKGDQWGNQKLVLEL